VAINNIVNIVVKTIGVIIFEDLVKQNHQEHNVAKPVKISRLVKNELII
tara:strand:+ start:424 stop:570 length:147 start_codon:yes stop_codon:yes gene_type:complete